MPRQKKNLAGDPSPVSPPETEVPSMPAQPAQPVKSPDLPFDVPGKLNHEPFPKGGKAEAIFLAWSKEPRKVAYIPLEPADVPGTVSAVAQFTINGLRINMLKGTTVEVPAPLAEHVEEMQAAARRALLAKTRDLIHGGMRNARIDLLSEAQKMGIL